MRSPLGSSTRDFSQTGCWPATLDGESRALLAQKPCEDRPAVLQRRERNDPNGDGLAAQLLERPGQLRDILGCGDEVAEKQEGAFSTLSRTSMLCASSSAAEIRVPARKLCDQGFTGSFASSLLARRGTSRRSEGTELRCRRPGRQQLVSHVGEDHQTHTGPVIDQSADGAADVL